jgi:pimeloyl-ACP methyl ester carboxylesterase
MLKEATHQNLETAKDLGVSISEYPFEEKGQSKYIEINGFQLHYLHAHPKEVDQNTPVLICIHGNPSWSFYYRNIVKNFEHTHRILVIDHIGCGLSQKPNEQDYPYTLSRRVADLSAWIECLKKQEGFQRFSLLVHDWGGMIGMSYATSFPQDIEKLVILNTAAFHKPKTKKLPFTLGLVRNTWLGKALVLGLNAFSGMAVYWAVTKPLSKEVKQGFTAPYHAWDQRIATYKFVQNIPLYPSDPDYDLVSQTESRLSLLQDKPMLILWGDQDFVFDHHFLKQWQHYFPSAIVKNYPDGGHYILEDKETSVIEEIKAFL